MTVTNAQVAALRSYLVEDAKEEVWTRQHEQLLHDGNLDDYRWFVRSRACLGRSVCSLVGGEQ